MTPTKDVQDIIEEAAELVRVSTPTFQKLANSLSASEPVKPALSPRISNEATNQAADLQTTSDYNEGHSDLNKRLNEETGIAKPTNILVQEDPQPKPVETVEHGKKKEKSVYFQDTPHVEPADREIGLNESKAGSEKLKTKEMNTVLPEDTNVRTSDLPLTDSTNTNLELYSNATLERKHVRKIKETKSSILKKEFTESKQAKTNSKVGKKDNRVKVNLQFANDRLNNSTDKSAGNLQITPTYSDESSADSGIKLITNKISSDLYDISEESQTDDKILVTTYENKHLMPLSAELKIEQRTSEHLKGKCLAKVAGGEPVLSPTAML